MFFKGTKKEERGKRRLGERETRGKGDESQYFESTNHKLTRGDEE